MSGFLGRALLIALMTIGVTACSLVGSERPDNLIDSRSRFEGVLYSLPQGVMTVVLSDTSGDLGLTMTGPTWIADSRHRYLLQHQPLPNYDDNIDIVVGKNGFLKTVNTTSTDRSLDILLNVVKAVAKLESAPQGTVEIARLTFDPTQQRGLDVVNGTLNRAASDHLRRNLKVCRGVYTKAAKAEADAKAKASPNKLGGPQSNDVADIGGDTSAPNVRMARADTPVVETKPKAKPMVKTPTNETPAKPDAETPPKETTAKFTIAGAVDANTVEQCDEYARLQAMVSAGERLVEIRVDGPPPIMPSKVADCSVGVCYRVSNPYLITLRTVSRVQQSMVELPNENPPIEIDIKRAFFVKKVKNISFDPTDGSLSQVTIDKPSEALALSKFGLDVVQTVLDAPAEALRIRIDQRNKEKQFVDSNNALINATAAAKASALPPTIPVGAKTTTASGVKNTAEQAVAGGGGTVIASPGTSNTPSVTPLPGVDTGRQ